MATHHDLAEGVSAADAGRRRRSGAVGDPTGRVERTCTELQTDGPASNGGDPRSLSDFREVAALVLLGGPGAGKSTEFETESEALGDVAMLVSARSFVAFDPPCLEWWNKTLFIDGLDEVRAGAANARSPLDQVRNRLHQLGRPPFRLSCREADWLGNNDLQALAEVSSNSRITVLRLDPLASSAARELLNLRRPEVDAQKFMVDAWRQGIHSMLTNPLTLTLLADAVAPSGVWPDSRRAIFEAACLKMARELNDEHHVGGVGLPDEVLVDAAGFLCALLLLADEEAWSHGPGSGPTLCVSLDDLGSVTGDPSRSALRAALGTKLFASPDGTGFVPLHRQVAEFLAGRHLAKRITEGLPASRVVALMTSPSDGRVVTSLRGLSGWLAAHSPQARGQLIDDDPVGVALYGDISGFGIDDMERLLSALDALPLQAPILDYEQPDSRGDMYSADTAWAFRHLACAGMVGSITDLLSREGAEPRDERLKLLVLGAVSMAVRSEIPNLACLLPVLEALVGDASQPAAMRRSALDAYRHILPGGDRARVLVDLLNELDADADSDLDGELRGTLLGDLYPTAVTPTRIWHYARGPYQQHFPGRFRHFWTEALTECLSVEQFEELLDALCEDTSQLIPAVRRASGRAELPVEILNRGLTMFDATESTRLDRWLRIVGVYEWHSNGDSEPMRRIRAWLAAHPHAQRTVFLMRLRRRSVEESTRSWAWRLFDPVLKGTMHATFGLWCLETAIELADEEPTVSQTLLTHSFVSLEDPLINDGLTLEVMRERTRGCPDLARELEELCQEQAANESATPDPQAQADEESWAEQRAEEEQSRAARAQQIRSRETELRENKFSVAGLHELATEFLGVFSDSDPPASGCRLADYLGGDAVAVDAALAGLRNAVRRDDVPDVEETISLHLKGQQPWLAYPVLASLQLLDEEDPASLDILDEATKRKALAIHYCIPLGDPHPRVGRITWFGPPAGNDPPADDQPSAWQDRWLDKSPELVLDVLYRCAAEGIRHGMEHPPGLRDLDAVTNYDDAVQNIRLKLLESFPSRGSDARLFLLDSLAAKALNHADWTTLRGLARRKAALTSMTVGQRVRWLAIDAAVSPPSRLQRLKEFINGNRNRTRHLAKVLQHPLEHIRGASDRSGSISSILAGRQEPATLKALIEMLGPYFGPTDWGGYVTVEKAMSEYLIGLIGNLGSLAGDDTQETLQSLIDNSQLASWHGFLKMARERQKIVHRDYSYQPEAIDQVQRTLGGGAPANAADLAALLSGHLADVGANIRGDNDNFWRHFWNENSYGQPTKSKPENSCRDALLTALRPLLPPGVRVEPEHRHAGESRADIEAIYGGFNIPIEIKPSSRSDLENGLHSQLIGKYTTDSAASGHGIYVVLWLGAPSGTPLATPEDLQQQLESTLTPDQEHQISVIVIDVTKPGTNPPPSSGS